MFFCYRHDGRAKNLEEVKKLEGSIVTEGIGNLCKKVLLISGPKLGGTNGPPGSAGPGFD